MHKQLIERYVGGAGLLSHAISGLSAADLAARPVPGTWSLQEIVVHLCDSDLIGGDRIRRIASMKPAPLIISYDESAFIAHLSPHAVDPAMCAEAFRLGRLMVGQILRTLPEESFSRFGVHNERGKMTLADAVRTYVDHVDGHLKHLYRKRELIGKPIEARYSPPA